MQSTSKSKPKVTKIQNKYNKVNTFQVISWPSRQEIHRDRDRICPLSSHISEGVHRVRETTELTTNQAEYLLTYSIVWCEINVFWNTEKSEMFIGRIDVNTLCWHFLNSSSCHLCALPHFQIFFLFLPAILNTFPVCVLLRVL